MPDHQHKTEHRVVTNTGTVYEVCDCGATRVGSITSARDGRMSGWHTCALCTHAYGLTVLQTYGVR